MDAETSAFPAAGLTYSRPALDLLAALGREGFALRVEDGKLLVSPSARLTDAHREAVRTHRDGLVALVRDMPSPEAEAALDAAGPPESPGLVERVVLDLGGGKLMVTSRALYDEIAEYNRVVSGRWAAKLAAKRGDTDRPVKAAKKPDKPKTLFGEAKG